MSYQISRIRDTSVSGIKVIFTRPVGNTFHPIAYKNRKYIIDFESVLAGIPSSVTAFDEEMILAKIYPYQEKFNLFTGHKGKKLYQTDITLLTLDDGELHNLRSDSLDTIKIHLPEIMKIIFGRYEDALQGQVERQTAAQAAEAWDGVVRSGV